MIFIIIFTFLLPLLHFYHPFRSFYIFHHHFHFFVTTFIFSSNHHPSYSFYILFSLLFSLSLPLLLSYNPSYLFYIFHYYFYSLITTLTPYHQFHFLHFHYYFCFPITTFIISANFWKANQSNQGWQVRHLFSQWSTYILLPKKERPRPVYGKREYVRCVDWLAFQKSAHMFLLSSFYLFYIFTIISSPLLFLHY
jgi:hypothetical protein